MNMLLKYANSLGLKLVLCCCIQIHFLLFNFLCSFHFTLIIILRGWCFPNLHYITLISYCLILFDFQHHFIIRLLSFLFISNISQYYGNRSNGFHFYLCWCYHVRFSFSFTFLILFPFIRFYFFSITVFNFDKCMFFYSLQIYFRIHYPTVV